MYGYENITKLKNIKYVTRHIYIYIYIYININFKLSINKLLTNIKINLIY